MSDNETRGDLLVHPDAQRWGGWTWNEPRDGEHFRRCSFCGSVNPDDLAAEAAWRADWADRKYGWPHKFYVDIPNRTPDRLYVVASTYGGRDDRPLEPGWIRWDELSTQERRIADRDGCDHASPPLAVKFGTRPHHHGKFYTVHLAHPDLDPQVKQAIEQRSGLGFDFHDGKVRWFPAVLQSATEERP